MVIQPVTPSAPEFLLGNSMNCGYEFFLTADKAFNWFNRARFDHGSVFRAITFNYPPHSDNQFHNNAGRFLNGSHSDVLFLLRRLK
jgi:hypothetical protein